MISKDRFRKFEPFANLLRREPPTRITEPVGAPRPCVSFGNASIGTEELYPQERDCCRMVSDRKVIPLTGRAWGVIGCLPFDLSR